MPMKTVLGLIAMLIVSGCSGLATTKLPEFTDLSKRNKPDAIIQNPWQEVIINVVGFSEIAPFFTEIGQFETIDKSETYWVLAAPGSDNGYVRLRQIGAADPARPASSTAWDKGCYYSLMMRAKNLETIVRDARELGWTPLTEMAYLEFGPSKLHIIVLTHESGVRVQLYERLTTPVPAAFPSFERISRPFNIMQMVEDRDASYDFFQQKLGFDTFFYGPPFVSDKEEVMPLGIPTELTTTILYKTAIMTPKTGLEWGRMEMIDIEDMAGGVDYSGRCTLINTGIVGVRFLVEELSAIQTRLSDRGIDFTKDQNTLWIKSPDGSNLGFFERPAD